MLNYKRKYKPDSGGKAESFFCGRTAFMKACGPKARSDTLKISDSIAEILMAIWYPRILLVSFVENLFFSVDSALALYSSFHH